MGRILNEAVVDIYIYISAGDVAVRRPVSSYCYLLNPERKRKERFSIPIGPDGCFACVLDPRRCVRAEIACSVCVSRVSRISRQLRLLSSSRYAATARSYPGSTTMEDRVPVGRPRDGIYLPAGLGCGRFLCERFGHQRLRR